MQLGTKGGKLITKGGKLADGCRCCPTCPAACSDLVTELEIHVTGSAASGIPWTNTSPVSVSTEKVVPGTPDAFWPNMLAKKRAISFDAIDDTVTIPASLFSSSTPLTVVDGASGQISASVFGCTAAVTVTQTTVSSLVYADTYYAVDNNGNQLYLLQSVDTPVGQYEFLTKETRSISISFSMALYREFQINRYWDAMDNAVFPFGTAWRQNRSWSSTDKSGLCAGFQQAFTLTESTTGYLSSVQPGDEYNGIGLGGISFNLPLLDPGYGRQIRIGSNLTADITVK